MGLEGTKPRSCRILRWVVEVGAYRDRNSRGQQTNASIALVSCVFSGAGEVVLPLWLVAQAVVFCFPCPLSRNLAGPSTGYQPVGVLVWPGWPGWLVGWLSVGEVELN